MKTKGIVYRILVAVAVIILGVVLSVLIKPEWNFFKVETWLILQFFIGIAAVAYVLLEIKLDDEYVIGIKSCLFLSFICIAMVVITGAFDLIRFIVER